MMNREQNQSRIQHERSMIRFFAQANEIRKKIIVFCYESNMNKTNAGNLQSQLIQADGLQR